MMRFASPKGWVLVCLSVAPAVISLFLVYGLHILESKGKITGEPAMGVAPTAGLLTLVVCIVGSLLPAIWLNKKGDRWATLNYWFGLAVLNVLLTIPGCASI